MGWPRMSLAVAGQSVVYTTSTAARITPGGYTIHRTDTFILPLHGDLLAGTRKPGIVLRTSAGRTTAGPLAGGPSGRHVLIATGVGFTPQVIFCCRPTTRDFPIDASSRPDAPVAVAAAIDWPLVRVVRRSKTDGVTLLTRTVGEGPGQPFASRAVTALDVDPSAGLVAMSAQTLAWVDRRTPREIRVVPLAPGATAPDPLEVIPVTTGQVVRLHATDQTVAALIRHDGGYELVRYDLPGRRPEVAWSGPAPPGPTAAGGGAVVVIDGSQVLEQVAGQAAAQVLRLRGTGAAVATDGLHVAIIERIRVQGRRGLLQRSAIRVAPILAAASRRGR